jgi:hypothetical protein
MFNAKASCYSDNISLIELIAYAAVTYPSQWSLGDPN